MANKFSVGDLVYYKTRNGNKLLGRVINIHFDITMEKGVYDILRKIYTLKIYSIPYRYLKIDAYEEDIILIPTKQIYGKED